MRHRLARSLAIASTTAAALVALAAPAHAQSAGSSPWYGTLELGAGRIDNGSTGQGLSANGLTGTASTDRTRGTLGLSLGYQFTPNFAVEGGYQSLGRYGYDAAITAPGADNLSGRWRADGLKVVAVGSVPITQDLSFQGKGGVMFARTQFDGTGSLYALDRSDHKAVLTVGAGFAYRLTPQMDALFGWDRYQHVGDERVTGRSDIDLFSVGLKYRF